MKEAMLRLLQHLKVFPSLEKSLFARVVIMETITNIGLAFCVISDV